MSNDKDNADNASIYTLRTDPENDVNGSNDEIFVFGEEYTAGQLRAGVALEHGKRLFMRPSFKGDEWVLYVLHIYDNAEEEVRRLPRRTVKLKKGRIAPSSAPDGPSDSSFSPLDATEPRLLGETSDMSEESMNVQDIAGSEAASPLGGAASISAPIAAASNSDPPDRRLSEYQHVDQKECGTSPFDMSSPFGVSDAQQDGEMEPLTKSEARKISFPEQLVQRLREIMDDYIQSMELFEDEDDVSMLGKMGNAVLPLFDKLKQIMGNLALISEDARPINRILVIGGEGTGKSTFINKLTMHLTKRVGGGECSDARLSEPQVEMTDKAFRENHEAVNLSEVHEEETRAHLDVFESFEYSESYNLKEDDILPTGTVEMTAIVTDVFLNPSLQAGERKLTLKYRTKDEIDTMIADARSIRDCYKKTKNREELPQVKRSDLLLRASFACCLLLIPKESDAIEAVQNYDGDFELPKRFSRLLGCERQIKLKSTSDENLWSRVSELLLKHTVGPWSHWAALEKVELEVPSRLDVPLYICDVPGFGDATTQPFRQSMIDVAMALRCSTLCVCTGKSKKNDLAKKGVAERLDSFRVFDDLCCKVATSRRIGTVTTLFPLDWVLEDTGRGKPINLERARRLHETYNDDSRDWLVKKANDSLAGRRRSSQQSEGTSDHHEDVISRIDEQRVKPITIDVRGQVLRDLTGGGEPWSMEHAVKTLLENRRQYLQAQQDEYLEQLINECLLPFYSRLTQICELRNLQPDSRFEFKAEKSLLRAVRDFVDIHLSRGEISKLRDQLDKTVISSYRELCTREAVIERFQSEEFEQYSKKGSRKLTIDLRSDTPERTLLPQLILRPLARDVVMPLQEALYNMLEALVDKPAKEFLEDLCFSIIKEELEKNMEKVPTQRDALVSFRIYLEDKLKGETKRTIEKFRRSLLIKIDAQLPREHLMLLRKLLASQDLVDIAASTFRTKSTSMNQEKVNELASRIEGENGMAIGMRNLLKSYVMDKILDTYSEEFIKEMERLINFFAGTVRNTVEAGVVAWFEKLDGFKKSFACARLLAGLVKAVADSERMSKYIKILGEEERKKMIELAEQPLVPELAEQPLVAKHKECQTPPRRDKQEATLNQWTCPNCGSTNAEQKGKLQIPVNCLRKTTPTCWCEEMTAEEVCYLCFRQYTKNHKKRTRQTEKDRLWHRKIRKRSVKSSVLPAPRKRQRALLTRLSMAIVDAHHHFYNPDIHLGGVPSWTPPQYVAAAENVGLAASVHVEAMPNDGAAEAEWVNQLAEAGECRVKAIVGYCNLPLMTAGQDLDALVAAAPSLLRGVRFILCHDGGQNATVPDYLRDPLAAPMFERGYQMLEKRNLSFDLECYPAQLPAAAEMCSRYPAVPVAINHLGKLGHLAVDGGEVDAARLLEWRHGMEMMSRLPHVNVKISMLGYVVPEWTEFAEKEELLRQLVLETIQLFGAQRCMFASNWHGSGTISINDGDPPCDMTMFELYQRYQSYADTTRTH